MAKARRAAPESDPAHDPAGLLAAAVIDRAVARREAPERAEVLDVADGEVARAAAGFAEWLQQPSPFAALVRQARLTLPEAEVLAVAIAVERDLRLQLAVSHLQRRDGDAVRLEVGTLDGLFGRDHPGPLTVGPASGLRAAALVDVAPGRVWSQQQVVVAPSVIWALVGDTATDPEMPLGFVVHDEPAPSADGAASVLVIGRDRARRREAGARRGAATRYLVGAAPPDGGWAALVREATVLGAGVMLDVDAGLSDEGRRWVDRARHLTWVLMSKHALALDRLPDRDWVEVTAGTHQPSDAEWRARLGDAERRHALSLDQLDQVATTMPLVGGDIDAAVRRLVSSRLEELALRIRPTRTWFDLILPEPQLRQLRELIDRYRHADRVFGDWMFPAVPSRGLVALFSGPSGTGKTLAAEVIAGELGLDVFKLDLSAVVSKYIGETEKNLEELFDAAGAGNLVLFFDEADALFGKRGEVKDAHDKYANLETSYLLQRLESYDGVVVMATNYEKNIDDAFMRRIHTRVDFASPTATERGAIWRRHLEYGAPIEGVDYEELARRFEVTGGAIRNAAVQAAFLAAAEDGPITMERVVRCLAREYRKLGRLLKPADFGAYYEVVAGENARG